MFNIRLIDYFRCPTVAIIFCVTMYVFTFSILKSYFCHSCVLFKFFSEYRPKKKKIGINNVTEILVKDKLSGGVGHL